MFLLILVLEVICKLLRDISILFCFITMDQCFVIR